MPGVVLRALHMLTNFILRTILQDRYSDFTEDAQRDGVPARGGTTSERWRWDLNPSRLASVLLSH